VASFGVRLKQEREQRGITLEEISSSTKIGTRMLVALEQDHFDQLPGGIFNKGFIRAYARCLGLDEDQAIADYLVASGNLSAEKEKEKDKDKDKDKKSDSSSFEFQDEAEHQQSTLPWGTLAILLLLVALAFAAWGFYSRQSRKNSRTATVPTRASVSASDTQARAPAPITPSAEIKTQFAPVTKPVSGDPNAVAPTPAGPNPSAVPKPLSLRIILHADSWLSITSDGHQILQGTSFSAPTEKTIRAAKEIVIKAGNIGALDLYFNGKKLPAQGADGEMKTLTFDATGLHASAPLPTAAPQP
jgi:cytoskeleton protein RodZ